MGRLTFFNQHEIEQPQYIGMFYAFLSAVLFSTFDLAVKFSGPYLTVWHMMFGRSLFGIVAVTVMARCMGLSILGHQRCVLIITGVTGVGGAICIMAALTLVPMFEVLVLLYLFPAFAGLLSTRLTGEKTAPLDWSLIGVAFGGATLILWSNELCIKLQWGHLFGLAAGFFVGLTVTLIRRLSAENNTFTPFFYMSMIGCLVGAGPLFWQESPFLFEAKGAIGLLAIATFAVAANLTFNKALIYLPAPKAGIISMMEVVFGGVCGFFIFDEPLSWRLILGGMLIIGSGVCLTVKRDSNSRLIK